jgi:hypothetical protein
MSIQKQAINTVAAVLLTNDVWVHSKALVATIENTDPILTGPEKKAAVLSELKAIGLDVGTAILNLAIELAVAYIKGVV